jgi:hypothetical protein
VAVTGLAAFGGGACSGTSGARLPAGAARLVASACTGVATVGAEVVADDPPRHRLERQARRVATPVILAEPEGPDALVDLGELLTSWLDDLADTATGSAHLPASTLSTPAWTELTAYCADAVPGSEGGAPADGALGADEVAQPGAVGIFVAWTRGVCSDPGRSTGS